MIARMTATFPSTVNTMIVVRTTTFVVSNSSLGGSVVTPSRPVSFVQAVSLHTSEGTKFVAVAEVGCHSLSFTRSSIPTLITTCWPEGRTLSVGYFIYLFLCIAIITLRLVHLTKSLWPNFGRTWQKKIYTNKYSHWNMTEKLTTTKVTIEHDQKIYLKYIIIKVCQFQFRSYSHFKDSHCHNIYWYIFQSCSPLLRFVVLNFWVMFTNFGHTHSVILNRSSEHSS